MSDPKRDILRDSAANDWQLDAGGDLAMATGLEAISQHIAFRVRMRQNSWFLDLDEGLPYYERILVKSPDLGAVRGIFRTCILGTPGVVELDALDLAYEPSTRTLLVSFTALCDTGTLVAPVSGSVAL